MAAAAREKLRTPSKESMAIYNEYRVRMKKIEEEKQLPRYMVSKFIKCVTDHNHE